MDALQSPKVWVAVAAASGGIMALRWFVNAPIPESNYEERARMTQAWFAKHLAVTHTFDQLVGGFETTHMGRDGTLSGSTVVEGPMVSAEGVLHEGALMCLVDTLTSVAVIATGSPTGVTVDMGFSALASVSRGERLEVDARTLRVGNTLAFTSCRVKRAGTDEVVAVGEQTKHIGMPWKHRLMHHAAARIMPLARYFHGKIMAASADSKLPRVAAATMEEALGLQPLPADAGIPTPPGGTRYWANMQLHLLNGYWAGHGASSAALLAAAVREHLKGLGVAKSRIIELSASYLRPVPAFKNVGVLVLPASNGAAEAGATHVFTAELCSEQGLLLVRARITAVSA